MTRRDALVLMGSAAGIAAAGGRLALQAQAVDPNFMRMWNAVQKRRPAVLTSRARIAPSDEPGVPLRIQTQLFDREGRRPVAGAIVSGYQTNKDGLYTLPGDQTWRLFGWARSDADGRATFDTIHPGPYPGRTTAAHIHFHVEGAGLRRQSLSTMMFEGDPLLSEKDRSESAKAGRFAFIRPITVRDGREECDILFHAVEEFVF